MPLESGVVNNTTVFGVLDVQAATNEWVFSVRFDCWPNSSVFCREKLHNRSSTSFVFVLFLVFTDLHYETESAGIEPAMFGSAYENSRSAKPHATF